MLGRAVRRCPLKEAGAASSGCPFHAWGLRSRRRVGASAGTTLSPSPSVVRSSSGSEASGGPQSSALVRSTPLVERLLNANSYQDLASVFATYRIDFSADETVLCFVRLAKVGKDPSIRLAPEVQKFVDILACACIDRLQSMSRHALCSVIWAASKLKRDCPKSGMFKSFLKAWAAELEPHLEVLELEQVRKVLASVARVRYTPAPHWRLKAEAALASRLTACACPRTLACCLVSAAGLGLGAAAPAPALLEAVATACASSFGASGSYGASASSEASGSSSGAEGAAGAGVGRGRLAARDAARAACSSLWAAASLRAPLPSSTVRAMLVHVTELGVRQAAEQGAARLSYASAASASASLDGQAQGEVGSSMSPFASISEPEGACAAMGPVAAGALTPLDLAQVYWALSKLRYRPSGAELAALLAATDPVLPSAPPVLLATIMWGLADLEVVPPEAWLQRTYAAFESQLDKATAEPLQALLHAAATLGLPAPQMGGRLMERLQNVDLRPLPDGNMVDLVVSLHALRMRPPPQLAARLQEECAARLGARSGGVMGGAASASPRPAGAGAGV